MRDQMQILLRNAEGGPNEVKRVGIQLVTELLKNMEMPDIRRIAEDGKLTGELAERAKQLLQAP